MRSAEPSQIENSGSPGVPKMRIRECSKNSPTRLCTVMFSDSPATPGRSEQSVRTSRRISTPAELAS